VGVTVFFFWAQCRNVLTDETVRPRVAPPPIIRARETTLSSTPSPPVSDRRLPPTPMEGSVWPRGVRPGSPAGRVTTGVTSAAPALVGVAETAPPWYVLSIELLLEYLETAVYTRLWPKLWAGEILDVWKMGCIFWTEPNQTRYEPNLCEFLNKKLCYRREAARFVVFDCSQRQHTYSAVFYY